MCEVTLQAPGPINARNALGVLLLARPSSACPWSAGAQALREFRGVSRRQEVVGEAARRHRDRRLRAPSDGGRGDAGRAAAALSRPPAARRVRAALQHQPAPGLPARVRRRAGRAPTRSCWRRVFAKANDPIPRGGAAVARDHRRRGRARAAPRRARSTACPRSATTCSSRRARATSSSSCRTARSAGCRGSSPTGWASRRVELPVDLVVREHAPSRSRAVSRKLISSTNSSSGRVPYRRSHLATASSPAL